MSEAFITLCLEHIRISKYLIINSGVISESIPNIFLYGLTS